MGSLNLKTQARLKRKKRIRKRIFGTQERPRLSVFRSAKHIYAQVINDTSGQTLVAASSMEEAVKAHFSQETAPVQDSEASESASGAKEAKGKVAMAVFVGKLVGERALEKGIKKIVFDRNGFLYHGRVKAVSDGARKVGLEL